MLAHAHTNNSTTCTFVIHLDNERQEQGQGQWMSEDNNDLPMNIVLSICGEIEVDHVTEFGYIQPTRRQLCAHYQSQSPISQSSENFL
jgi:hypothetical protein